MRPYFGEFLVQNEHIKSNQLLECMLEQLEGQPSLAEIIYDRHTLSVEDQLAILDEMSASGNSYISCLKSSHLMKKKEMRSLLSYMVESSPGLPEIIIANFIMKPGDLVSALDEYISQATEEGLSNDDENDEDGIVSRSEIAVDTASSSAPPEQSTDKPEVSLVTEKVSQVEVDSPDPAPIESSLLPVFLEQFLVEDIDSIRSKASEVGSVEDFISFCRETGGKLELFKGMSKFIRAQLLENVVNVSGDYIRNICNGDLPGKNEIKGLTNVIIDALDLIAEIRNSIEANQNESVFWDDGSKKSKYQEVVGALAA